MNYICKITSHIWDKHVNLFSCFYCEKIDICFEEFLEHNKIHEHEICLYCLKVFKLRKDLN